MTDVSEFVESFLSHAETRYDPVKAHEYYIKNRELKGRRNVSELRTKGKKEGWAYTKAEVDKERKQAFETASDANKQATAQLRERAKKRREEIQGKLRQLTERLTQESKATREQIAQEVKLAIQALPKAPAGLSKEQAAEFAAKRNAEIAKIRGDAKAKTKKVSDENKDTRKSVSSERAQVAAELKGSLNQAKETYKTARKRIKDKYEAELDKEFDSIRTNA